MAAKARTGRKAGHAMKNIGEKVIKALDGSSDGVIIGDVAGTVIYHNKAWLDIHALPRETDLRGKQMRDYERPELLPILDEVTKRLLEKGSCTYQFGTVRRDGVYHDVQITADMVRDADPPLVIVMLREVTDFLTMKNELSRRNVELTFVDELSHAVTNAKNQKQLIDRMLNMLGDFIGAKARGFYLVDHAKKECILLQSSGLTPALRKRVERIHLADSVFKKIVQSRRPIVLEEDLASRPRKDADIRQDVGIKRTIGFVLKTGTRKDYLMIFGLTEAKTIDLDVRRFFDGIAHRFGIGIERMVLLDRLKKSEGELRELAKRVIASGEAERRQCALMLHDELGQSLTGLKLELEMLEKHLSPLSPRARKSIDAIKTQYRFIAEGTRRVSKSLHPSMLEELGLVPTLNWYVDGFIRSGNLEVDIEEVGFDEDLPLPVSLALYRVAQEALTNVVRHSRATKVIIKLTKGFPCVIMGINDNGQGISPPKGIKKSKGLGLVNMRERVESLGGTFRIQSLRGKGTKIRVTVPIEVDNV